MRKSNADLCATCGQPRKPHAVRHLFVEPCTKPPAPKPSAPDDQLAALRLLVSRYYGTPFIMTKGRFVYINEMGPVQLGMRATPATFDELIEALGYQLELLTMANGYLRTRVFTETDNAVLERFMIVPANGPRSPDELTTVEEARVVINRYLPIAR